MTNQELYDLMDRFEKSRLCTLKFSSGDVSVELGKGGYEVLCAAPSPVPAVSSVEYGAGAEPQPLVITAPLVGTYYAAPAPGAEPFVSKGDRVRKGQTVCLIEAMKMMSEIPAPCDCVITGILKESGALAAYDEPLFRYEPC